MVDTQEGKILRNKEIKNQICNQQNYTQWLKDNLIHINDLPELQNKFIPSKVAIKTKQKIFGYTLEDIKFIIKPMAIEEKKQLAQWVQILQLHC